MKKGMITLMLSGLLAFSLAACSNRQEEEPAGNAKPKTEVSAQTEEHVEPEENIEPKSGEITEGTGTTQTKDGNTLVVYFSVPETTDAENMNAEEEYSTVVIDGEVLGNTQYVAYLIRQHFGADIFRIEPEIPYPMNHGELEAVATQESRDNALPAIAAQIENFDQYETIFVGYPNWYADMPRILYSLFDAYDFSGKTIVPFVTSGGSGFSGTIGTIQELEPDAEVITDGYSISRTRMEDAEAGVTEWLTGLGY